MPRLRHILLHLAGAAAALWVVGVIAYCLFTGNADYFQRAMDNKSVDTNLMLGLLALNLFVVPLLLYAELKRLRPQLAALRIPFSVAVATWYGLWSSCTAITVPWIGLYPNLIAVSLLLLIPTMDANHPWFFHTLTALNLLVWPPLGLLYDKWRAYQRRMTRQFPVL